jgi:hypothetical protein
MFEGLNIEQYGRGTIGAHGNLNKDILTNLKIPIPKNKKLIKDLDPVFQEIAKLQSEMKEAESQYKKLIKELSEEAIPSNKQIQIKSDNELNKSSEESDENTNAKEPIIKISKKKQNTTRTNVKSNVI